MDGSGGIDRRVLVTVRAGLVAAGVAAVIAIGLWHARPASGSSNCTINWDGGGGSQLWNVAANWSDATTHADRVPNGSDVVCILTPSTTVVHGPGTDSVQAVTVVTGDTLSLTSGEIDVTSASITSSVGSLSLSGGLWGGTATTKVTFSFSADGGSAVHAPMTLTSSAVSVIHGTFAVSSGAKFTNAGTLALAGTGTFGTQSTGSFHNTGTVTRSDAGVYDVDLTYDNDGTISVSGGELDLQSGDGGAVSAGTFTVGSGATMHFGGCGCAVGLSSTTVFNGSGTLLFTHVGPVEFPTGLTYQFPYIDTDVADLVLDRAFTIPVVDAENASTIDGSGALKVTDMFTLSGGVLKGTGTTTVPSGASFVATGNADIDGRIITLAAGSTSSITGTLTFQNDATIDNAGTLTLTGAGVLNPNNTGLLDNTGKLVHAGAGLFDIDIDIDNSGTVVVSSGVLKLDSPFNNLGVTRVTGGELQMPSFVFVNGGTLDLEGGSFTVGALDNDHQMTIGRNGLATAGTFTQTTLATLTPHIAGTTAGAGYGQLSTTGAATLAGTLAIHTDSPFVPPDGSSFAIVASESRVGQFDTVTGTDLGGDRFYSVDYGAGVTLSIAQRVITASVADAQVVEGDSGSPHATFTVSLDNASEVDVTVHFATADGLATQGSDYTSVSTTVRITAGKTAKTVSVPVVADHVEEANETFSVTLSRPVGAVIGDGRAMGTILDDDGPRPLLEYQLVTPGTDNWDIFSMNRLGGNRVQLTTATTQEGEAVWSPDGTRIAFVSFDDSDRPNLWLMNADGTGQHELLANGQEPAWSPDGHLLAFVRATGQGLFDVFTVHDDGTTVKRLTSDTIKTLDAFPAWSPDGSTIAFDRQPHGGDLRIWLMNTDGTNQRELAAGRDAAWSPDGTRLAVSLIHNVGVVDVSTGVVTAITDLSKKKGVDDPQWSSSGDEIAFSERTVSGIVVKSDVMDVNADGSGLHAVTTDGVDKGITAWRGCSIVGTSDGDFLTGTSGDDVICGGDGDDLIHGAGGDDILEGQGGSDQLVSGSGESDLDGGSGRDAANYSTSNTPVTASLTTHTGTAEGFDLIGRDVEDLQGSPFADHLTGDGGANDLVGRGGDDVIDVVDGVDGNDVADGGGGTDSCVADPGDTVISCP